MQIVVRGFGGRKTAGNLRMYDVANSLYLHHCIFSLQMQLFGDTVNTASRMESTGVKGRIQVSKDTADALTAAGKQDWLTPREDRIVAKGKGEMETFFVNIMSNAMTIRSTDTPPLAGIDV